MSGSAIVKIIWAVVAAVTPIIVEAFKEKESKAEANKIESNQNKLNQK